MIALYDTKIKVIDMLKYPSKFRGSAYRNFLSLNEAYNRLLESNNILFQYNNSYKMRFLLLFLFDYDEFKKLKRSEMYSILSLDFISKEHLPLILTKGALTPKYQQEMFRKNISTLLNSNLSFKQYVDIFNISANMSCTQCQSPLSHKGHAYCSICDANNINLKSCRFCGEAFDTNPKLSSHIQKHHQLELANELSLELYCPYCKDKERLSLTVSNKSSLTSKSLLYRCEYNCFAIKKASSSDAIEKFKITRSSNKDTTKYVEASLRREEKFKATIDIESGLSMKQIHSRKSAIKNSITMSNKIANGEFTPNVTNSWCDSRIDILSSHYRSTWEAYFFMYNANKGVLLEYETIRIPYYDSLLNKNRTYIIDFYDARRNIIYEIKPLSNINNQNVLDKEKGIIEFLKNNTTVTFEYISNDWFSSHYNENIIVGFENISQAHKDKCIRNLKQLKGKTHVNKN